MHLSPEEKQSLVARYHTGNSAAEICADTGIVRSTFYTRIKPCTTTKTNSGHVVSQQEFIKMKQRIQDPTKSRLSCVRTASKKLQELYKLYGPVQRPCPLRDPLCFLRYLLHHNLPKQRDNHL